jgi:hypothetical protein
MLLWLLVLLLLVLLGLLSVLLGLLSVLMVLLILLVVLRLLVLLLLCGVPAKARLRCLRVVGISSWCMHAKLRPCGCLMAVHAVRGRIACRRNVIGSAHRCRAAERARL